MWKFINLISLLVLTLGVGCSSPAPQQAACSLGAAGAAGAAGEAAVADEAWSPVEAPLPTYADRLNAEWTLDEDFEQDELETIIAAGEAWSEVTDGRVQLRFVIAPVDSTLTVPYTVAKGFIEAGTPGRSRIDASGPRIMLDADMFANDDCIGRLWLVAAHELGHGLGIHGHGTSGVMETEHVPTCDATFTAEDVELFNAANP